MRPRRTSCGTSQPCKRGREDEWERVFVAPLPHDHLTMNDELPEDIMTDLQERFDLLECGEWDLNEFQAFIASTIVQIQGEIARATYNHVRRPRDPGQNVHVIAYLENTQTEFAGTAQIIIHHTSIAKYTIRATPRHRHT